MTKAQLLEKAQALLDKANARERAAECLDMPLDYQVSQRRQARLEAKVIRAEASQLVSQSFEMKEG
jgi:hypothetical protein